MDVHKSKSDREAFLERYYTKEGVKALETRVEHLVKLWSTQKDYPAKLQMLGFPALKMHSKQHLEGMIDNMLQILGKDKITLVASNVNLGDENDNTISEGS